MLTASLTRLTVLGWISVLADGLYPAAGRWGESYSMLACTHSCPQESYPRFSARYTRSSCCILHFGLGGTPCSYLYRSRTEEEIHQISQSSSALFSREPLSLKQATLTFGTPWGGHERIESESCPALLHPNSILNERSAQAWRNLGTLYFLQNDFGLANDAFHIGSTAPSEFAHASVRQGLLPLLMTGEEKKTNLLFSLPWKYLNLRLL